MASSWSLTNTGLFFLWWLTFIFEDILAPYQYRARAMTSFLPSSDLLIQLLNMPMSDFLDCKFHWGLTLPRHWGKLAQVVGQAVIECSHVTKILSFQTIDCSLRWHQTLGLQGYKGWYWMDLLEMLTSLWKACCHGRSIHTGFKASEQPCLSIWMGQSDSCLRHTKPIGWMWLWVPPHSQYCREELGLQLWIVPCFISFIFRISAPLLLSRLKCPEILRWWCFISSSSSSSSSYIYI